MLKSTFGHQRTLLAALLLGVFTTALSHGQSRLLTLEDFRPQSGKWKAASEAAVSPRDSERLILTPGSGLLANGEAGETVNLLTSEEFGDLEVHVEFMIPEGSNSGVYLQGRYEVQIRDSHGVDRLQHSDAGGIYQRWDESREPKGWGGVPPLVNATLPPGEWQSLDIVFRAPRFDADGRKTEDALFVRVDHNGVLVQREVPVSGPTRAAAFSDERAVGPLMLQGDHGPIVYRNVRVRPL